MKKEDEKIVIVEYESLLEKDDFPKSRWQLVGRLFKNSWNNIKKDPKKTIVPALVITLIMFLFYTVFLAYINDTVYLYKILPAYTIPGMINPSTPGYYHYHTYVNNLLFVLPLYILNVFILKKLIVTCFTKGAAKKFFSSLFSVNSTTKKYKQLLTKPVNVIFLKSFIVAFVLGFILKNPLTLFLLSFLLFLSFAKNNDSELMSFIAMLKVTKNIKDDKNDFVSMGDAAFLVLGLSIGFLLNLIMNGAIWFLFYYRLWARAVFTVLFIALFAYTMIQSQRKQKSKRKDTITAAMLTFIICGLAMGSNYVYGDDGGWSESGATLSGWISNPGTKILVALGFTGSLGNGLGWIMDTAWSGVPNFLGIDSVVKATSLFGGFGKEGSYETNTTFATAALGTALGPLGNMLGNAVTEIDGALRGDTGGDNGYTGGDNGYTGGDNGYTGGDNGYTNVDKKPKDRKDTNKKSGNEDVAE